MPIRYFIDLNCTPRTELGEEELLTLLSRWERALNVRQQFQEKYKLNDESRMRFRETVTTPTGVKEKRELSVADLRRECSDLGRLQHHCENCPASLTGRPYGCTQSLDLPIGQWAERWLVDRLAPAGSRALELFFDAASRNDYGSSPILQNWRKAEFLEAEQPAKADRSGLAVTSDQILQELFLVGDLMPTHLLGVLIHLQALKASDGREGDDLLALLENVDAEQSTADAPTIDFAIHSDPEDDEAVRQMKQFLYAGYIAFSLQVPLAIRI